MKSEEFSKLVLLNIGMPFNQSSCYHDVIGLTANLDVIKAQQIWFKNLPPLSQECIRVYKNHADQMVNMLLRSAKDHSLDLYFSRIAHDPYILRVFLCLINPKIATQAKDPFWRYENDGKHLLQSYSFYGSDDVHPNLKPFKTKEMETFHWLVRENIVPATKAYAKMLCDLLHSAPSLKAPLLVCRGVNWDPKIIPRAFQSRAFSSTAYSFTSFGSNLHIVLPKGCPALFIDSVSKNDAEWAWESEVLIPPKLTMIKEWSNSDTAFLVVTPKSESLKTESIKFLQNTKDARSTIKIDDRNRLHKKMIEAMIRTKQWPDLALKRKSPIKNAISIAKAKRRFPKSHNPLILENVGPQYPSKSLKSKAQDIYLNWKYNKDFADYHFDKSFDGMDVTKKYIWQKDYWKPDF